MQASAEAERLERLESDAIDVLASLWAAAHQEAVAEPDASASVVTATHPEVQSDHGSAPGESMEIEPAVHSGKDYSQQSIRSVASQKRRLTNVLPFSRVCAVQYPRAAQPQGFEEGIQEGHCSEA